MRSAVRLRIVSRVATSSGVLPVGQPSTSTERAISLAPWLAYIEVRPTSTICQTRSRMRPMNGRIAANSMAVPPPSRLRREAAWSSSACILDLLSGRRAAEQTQLPGDLADRLAEVGVLDVLRGGGVGRLLQRPEHRGDGGA